MTTSGDKGIFLNIMRNKNILECVPYLFIMSLLLIQPGKSLALDFMDVVYLSSRGVSAEEIINRIKQENAVFRLTKEDVAELRKNGVNEKVIRYMWWTDPERRKKREEEAKEKEKEKETKTELSSSAEAVASKPTEPTKVPETEKLMAKKGFYFEPGGGIVTIFGEDIEDDITGMGWSLKLGRIFQHALGMELNYDDFFPKPSEKIEYRNLNLSIVIPFFSWRNVDMILLGGVGVTALYYRAMDAYMWGPSYRVGIEFDFYPIKDINLSAGLIYDRLIYKWLNIHEDTIEEFEGVKANSIAVMIRFGLHSP